MQKSSQAMIDYSLFMFSYAVQSPITCTQEFRRLASHHRSFLHLVLILPKFPTIRRQWYRPWSVLFLIIPSVPQLQWQLATLIILKGASVRILIYSSHWGKWHLVHPISPEPSIGTREDGVCKFLVGGRSALWVILIDGGVFSLNLSMTIILIHNTAYEH